MLTARPILELVLAASAAFALPLAARGDNGVSLQAGQRAFMASEYDKAIQILTTAAAADPQNGEIAFWLTRAYLELQQEDNAYRSGERAVSLSPQNSEYHHWLGKAYGEKASHAPFWSALGWARKAHRKFETAVRLDARNFAARQDLIEYLCGAPGIAGGGEDKASVHIEQLAAMDAAEGFYAKGNCRRQKKDFAAADAEFAKALEASPRSADLIYDVGDYAMKRSQPDRLLAVAEAGRKADPADPRGDFYRALVFILRNEKPAEAERLLRAYLVRAPVRSNYPHPTAVHEWLGRLFEQQVKCAEAVREYQAELQLDPKNKNAREALKKLGKCGSQ